MLQKSPENVACCQKGGGVVKNEELEILKGKELSHKELPKNK